MVAAAVFAAGVVLSHARAADWVKDPQNGCATSNPFPNPNESIRWSGGCAGGKLDGKGTLIWFRDGVETERNDGTFHQGEMDGYAVTRYADGNVVHGQYKEGQRHGSFMTVRSGGEHVSATYVEGRLLNQRRLTRAEAAAWQRNGGPQQIANAAPPAAESAASAPGGSEPITGRTAIASPSRILPPPPKPAEAPGKPIAAAKPPVRTGGNFTLGTQVADAVGSGNLASPQPITPAAAPPARAANPAPAVPVPAAAAPASAVPAAPMPRPAVAALPTLPQFSLGSQVAGAVDQPTTLSATAPALPMLTANLPGLPAQQPPQQAAQPLSALSAAPVPAPLPQQVPLQARAQPASQHAESPGPARGMPTATTPRRPPWMAAGAPDPISLGPALPGATPSFPPPTPMAGAAPPPGPTAYGQAPGYAAAEPSPTEASRLYLAQREGGASAPQMAALPSYRALQPASPYPPPAYVMPVQPAPVQQPAAPLPPVAMPGGGLYAAAGPEALFKQGYQLEMSGRFREAEQTYEQVMIGYSNTQTAMLANERLNGLRRFTRETGVRIAGQPGADRQSQVVAVNEPRVLPGHAPQDPAYALPPPFTTGGAGAGAT
ncbi:MAG: hypothetical protein ACT4N4_09915, partial [Rhodospirillales bacterium]